MSVCSTTSSVLSWQCAGVVLALGRRKSFHWDEAARVALAVSLCPLCRQQHGCSSALCADLRAKGLEGTCVLACLSRRLGCICGRLVLFLPLCGDSVAGLAVGDPPVGVTTSVEGAGCATLLPSQSQTKLGAEVPPPLEAGEGVQPGPACSASGRSRWLSGWWEKLELLLDQLMCDVLPLTLSFPVACKPAQ